MWRHWKVIKPMKNLLENQDEETYQKLWRYGPSQCLGFETQYRQILFKLRSLEDFDLK
jgi:hypothetical protein